MSLKENINIDSEKLARITLTDILYYFGFEQVKSSKYHVEFKQNQTRLYLFKDEMDEIFKVFSAAQHVFLKGELIAFLSSEVINIKMGTYSNVIDEVNSFKKEDSWGLECANMSKAQSAIIEAAKEISTAHLDYKLPKVYLDKAQNYLLIGSGSGGNKYVIKLTNTEQQFLFYTNPEEPSHNYNLIDSTNEGSINNDIFFTHYEHLLKSENLDYKTLCILIDLNYTSIVEIIDKSLSKNFKYFVFETSKSNSVFNLNLLMLNIEFIHYLKDNVAFNIHFDASTNQYELTIAMEDVREASLLSDIFDDIRVSLRNKYLGSFSEYESLYSKGLNQSIFTSRFHQTKQKHYLHLYFLNKELNINAILVGLHLHFKLVDFNFKINNPAYKPNPFGQGTLPFGK